MVVHACNQSTQEMKAGGSRIQGQPGLQNTNYTWGLGMGVNPNMRTVSKSKGCIYSHSYNPGH